MDAYSARTAAVPTRRHPVHVDIKYGPSESMAFVTPDAFLGWLIPKLPTSSN